MLDVETMRAMGMVLARQARAMARDEATAANEVIDIAPLLRPWQAGTMAAPVAYVAGEVYAHAGEPWRCAQGHTHSGEDGWAPGEAGALWTPYHGTDAAHARAWHAPTGAHDAYNAGEWMIWTDGMVYRCTQDATVHDPEALPSAWEQGE